jgi:hypothetical protein
VAVRQGDRWQGDRRGAVYTVDAYTRAPWTPDGVDWANRVAHRRGLVYADAVEVVTRLAAWSEVPAAA